jgi:hypothetical protein
MVRVQISFTETLLPWGRFSKATYLSPEQL